MEVAVRFTVRLTGRPEELSFKGNDMFLCAAITRCDRLNVQEWTFSCWAQNKKLLVGHTFCPIFNNVFMYQHYQLCLSWTLFTLKCCYFYLVFIFHHLLWRMAIQCLPTRDLTCQRNKKPPKLLLTRELFKEGRNLPHFIFCTVKNEILIKTTFLFFFFYPKINSLLETKHIPAELWETLNWRSITKALHGRQITHSKHPHHKP